MATFEEIDAGLTPLIEEYRAFNEKHGLSLGSADEHHNDDALTAEQQAWVRDFSRRWENAAPCMIGGRWTSNDHEALLDRMKAAGYAEQNTGGGCVAWEKYAADKDHHVWLGTEAQTLGLGLADKFGVMLQNSEGDFANGPTEASLDECMAWAEKALADPQPLINAKED